MCRLSENSGHLSSVWNLKTPNRLQGRGVGVAFNIEFYSILCTKALNEDLFLAIESYV